MTQFKPGSFLDQIDIPQDLRAKFSLEDLPQVSAEVRQYIIDVISEIGNSHFGASLGVVELTVALHLYFKCIGSYLTVNYFLTAKKTMLYEEKNILFEPATS